METDETQRRLGLYFAGINVASILIATATGLFTGLKEALIAFIASIIILTILVQSYAKRKLEKKENN